MFIVMYFFSAFTKKRQKKTWDYVCVSVRPRNLWLQYILVQTKQQMCLFQPFFPDFPELNQ